MKEFKTQISLHKYLELGGELQPKQILMCIERYPCIFISKRMKIYTDRDGVKTKLMHYKVEMATDGLYPLGSIKECFIDELDVLLLATKYEPYFLKDENR
jgi:hypothetical protein